MGRTTAEIHEDIYATTRMPTTTLDEVVAYYATLGRLWREMARVSADEGAPGWATSAAALLADGYDREVREAKHL